RTALDLEDAGGVGLLDRLVRGWVVVGDSRKVDPLAAPRRDHLDAALNRREHPQSEQVDLQEARVAAGVLVPHDHLPALHRGGHDGAAVRWGPGRRARGRSGSRRSTTPTSLSPALAAAVRAPPRRRAPRRRPRAPARADRGATGRTPTARASG